MAHITLTLSFLTPLNVSVQIGDVGYFVEVNQDVIEETDFDTNFTTPNTAPIQQIGPIEDIEVISTTQTNITFNIHTWNNIPGGQSLSIGGVVNTDKYFCMFAKDNAVNLSNVLGYYAKARFENDSIDRAELFSVGSEVQQSSK